MAFDPVQADIRFGCGVSQSVPSPTSVHAMLTALSGPDRAAAQFPIGGFKQILTAQKLLVEAKKTARKSTSETQKNGATSTRRQVMTDLRRTSADWLTMYIMRRSFTADGFRERLVGFWSDHFTAAGKGGAWPNAHLPYAEQAIRPHVAGRFADMLRAAVTHPLMLHYLDQNASFGPDSPAARKSKKKRGLNENLAREMLELHTLGVSGPYTQDDVRQLAELLTGLTFNLEDGFKYRPGIAEPGAETVLGISYGGDTASLNDIYAAIDDLARHPATAQYIAHKLSVHFVSDVPDPDLVEAITERYLETDGNLLEVYAAMLSHSAAWGAAPGNVKRPIDFICSAARALDLSPDNFPTGNFKRIRDQFMTPLAVMGQPWGRPPGPDGWPEGDADWITPQRLAGRVQWAMTVPLALRTELPDPRAFVEAVLGDTAPAPVRFAAASAETRAEGIGLVLASPAFQRM